MDTAEMKTQEEIDEELIKKIMVEKGWSYEYTKDLLRRMREKPHFMGMWVEDAEAEWSGDI